MGQISAITEIVTHGMPDCLPGMTLGPDVVLAVVDDGSSRLIDLNGSSFGVPAHTTSLLVASLRFGPDEAARCVADDRGVTPEMVREDLRLYLDDLERRGLIMTAGRERSGGRRLRRLLARPFGRALRLVEHPWLSLPIRIWVTLALAKLSFHVLGWSATVELWGQADGPTFAEPHVDSDAARLDAILREESSRHLMMAECKERALCAWRILRAAGRQASLVVGIDLYPFLGHCWCESEGRAVGDDLDRCIRFIPVARYS
jgi:hypothetical protein